MHVHHNSIIHLKKLLLSFVIERYVSRGLLLFVFAAICAEGFYFRVSVEISECFNGVHVGVYLHKNKIYFPKENHSIVWLLHYGCREHTLLKNVFIPIRKYCYEEFMCI